MSEKFIPWDDMREYCFDHILDVGNDTLFDLYIKMRKGQIDITRSGLKRKDYQSIRKEWREAHKKQLKLFDD